MSTALVAEPARGMLMIAACVSLLAAVLGMVSIWRGRRSIVEI
ncbi:hypothetical protein [Sphaerisporangium rubeum]|nr:hypothetical protein [Sphaerisporangium rubeum]